MFLGLGLVGGRVGRKVDEIMIIVEDPADLLDIWRASRLADQPCQALMDEGQRRRIDCKPKFGGLPSRIKSQYFSKFFQYSFSQIGSALMATPISKGFPCRAT